MTPQSVVAQGQAQANQFNAQAQQSAGQFGNYSNQANAAGQNLSAYGSTMADPAKLYSSSLQNAQSMYGFNPTDLLKAQKVLATTQTTLANLPDAIRQQGNYYGTTAGQEANNYSQQAGLLSNVLAGQTNAVGAYQNVLGATQNQAGQEATLGFQGEQLKEQNLEAVYSQSVQKMQIAQSNMQYFSNLYQQQGMLTNQQLQGLAAAQASYASAQSSQASAQQALAQSKLLQQQYSAQQDYLNAAKNQGGQLKVNNSPGGSLGIPMSGNLQGGTGLQ